MTSTPISRAYPEHAFGGFTRCDTTVAFYGRLNALVNSTSMVLDVGCGRAGYFEKNASSDYRINMRNFRGKAKRVIGIDLDDAGERNVSLDEFRLIKDIDNWPVEDASMDVVFSDFVMEHVDDPPAFFTQASRVLKPGGLLALRTPNRWSYVSIAASLIPNRLHGKVTGAVQEDRAEEDVFPVRYRCNTRGAMRRAMNIAGFDAAVWSIEGEPAYFAFSSMAYWLASRVHRMLPSPMRTTLLAFGRKRPH